MILADNYLPYAVGSSISSLSGLYTTTMKAAGASRRVFQLLDRVSTMPKHGDKCPVGLVPAVIQLQTRKLGIHIHTWANIG